STLYTNGDECIVPPAPAEPVKDPTGGGDAYRAGLFKGLMLGLPLPVSGRLGSLAATYAVEQHGPQEHSYTAEAFVERFDRTFPNHAGALQTAWLASPVSRSDASAHLDAVAGTGA
ncbi:MAG: PfkB family carbohydrate kinase, partial [Thermomicrobiales bacterium]